jgi:hypothetical protein
VRSDARLLSAHRRAVLTPSHARPRSPGWRGLRSREPPTYRIKRDSRACGTSNGTHITCRVRARIRSLGRPPPSLPQIAQRSSGPTRRQLALVARLLVRRDRGACRQLSLSRGVRRRPRSQRGIGTGSRTDSRGLWSAARASRLGRSCGSRCSCHAGLGGVGVCCRVVVGGGLFLPSLMVRIPCSRVPRADHVTANPSSTTARLRRADSAHGAAGGAPLSRRGGFGSGLDAAAPSREAIAPHGAPDYRLQAQRAAARASLAVLRASLLSGHGRGGRAGSLC